MGTVQGLLGDLTLDVADGTRMPVHIARPTVLTDQTPGIIVLQEVYGVTDFLRQFVACIADELGAVAIAPELYHRTGTAIVGDYGASPRALSQHSSALSVDGMAADVQATMTWLQEQGVAPARSAAIGFCMGGRVAFLANAHVSLGAAVSFYGGRIAPDWLTMVPSQHGPLLFFWAALDHTIPVEQRRAVEDALTAADVVRHAHVTFSDAEHGFFNQLTKGYHAARSREAWTMIVEFLRNAGVLPAHDPPARL